MEYTIVLTKHSNFLWRASVPALPECEVEADSREKVLSKIKEKVVSIASQSEVIQVEIPIKPQFSNETNGSYFGIFREDKTWSELFDKIEENR